MSEESMSWEEMEVLADQLEAFNRQLGYTTTMVATPERIREEASRFKLEMVIHERRRDRLARFITKVYVDNGWLTPSRVTGDVVIDKGVKMVAEALLATFDIEYKDKSGPSLGEDVDPDDYK